MERGGKKKLERRQFIARTCAGTIGLPLLSGLSLGASCATADKPSKKANSQLPKVVLRSDTKIFGTHGQDSGRVLQIVHRAICSLVGAKTPAEAYRELFKPTDIVAIKLNCLAGPGLSSSVAVVDALVAGLRLIGIENRNIYIWERTSLELQKAGFELNRHLDSRPRCFGNDEAGFARNIEFSGDIGSLFTNILARRATALINVPVIKDHDLSGLGCGMKNMYGAIHNPNRYHENNCDPYVADVCAHPYIKDKLRLVLADALAAQYQGGPASVIAHQWRPGAVMAARDPVALDRVAQTVIEEERAKHGLPSLSDAKRPPKWLKTAAQKELGENRLNKIVIDRG
ncbi:MAG: DUF362 domain-containing protein [Myxococcota bacterium]|nr:DUF362 domain-containing protein [Myxococcota bacterium]